MLTPEEQQELASLEAELTPKSISPAQSTGLTPEEQAELQQLETELADLQPVGFQMPEYISSIPKGSTVPAGQEKVSALESGMRGLAQSATFGFADEITAMLESAVTDKTYEQAQKESEQAYLEAARENPKAYMAGEIAGAFVPGAGIAKTGKLATKGISKAVGKVGVKEGAKKGLSKAQDLIQKASEAVLKGEQKVLSKLPKPVQSAYNKINSFQERVDEMPFGEIFAGGMMEIVNDLGFESYMGLNAFNKLKRIKFTANKAAKNMQKKAKKMGIPDEKVKEGVEILKKSNNFNDLVKNQEKAFTIMFGGKEIKAGPLEQLSKSKRGRKWTEVGKK